MGYNADKWSIYDDPSDNDDPMDIEDVTEEVASENMGAKGITNRKLKLVKKREKKYKGVYVRSSKLNKMSEEEQVRKAKIKLSKRLPARSRRAVRRLILFSNTESIDLKNTKQWKDICSFYMNNTRNKTGTNIIVDSGTEYHIFRDKENFKQASNEKIRIKGVSGSSYGYKGVLKNSVLGTNISAVWFKQLPVECLLSVEHLKKRGWETMFMLKHDFIRNARSGEILYLNKDSSTGLPVMKLTFSNEIQETQSYICSPCEDSYTNIQAYNNLPKRLVKSNNGKQTKRGKTQTSRLLQHQRMCHMHVDGVTRTRCLDCMESKGKRGGASKVRDPKYRVRNPLMLFSADFFGKVTPTSIRSNKWVLLFICDECNFAHAECIPKKSDAPQALERFTKQIRQKCGTDKEGRTMAKQLIVAGIHTDNEPVLTGTKWKSVCNQLGITELHSVPYVPQMNGTIERFVGTMKDALRTTLFGVDGRVWDWALEHIISVWNMKQHRKCAKHNNNEICAPNKILSNISDNPFEQGKTDKQKYLRRFGCLAFFKACKNPKEMEKERNLVLIPKRLRGIHLGFSNKNSAWIIGTINYGGYFTVYESRDVSFCEDILVNDVRALDVISNPDPPFVKSLLDKLNVVAEKGKSVGAETSVVGEMREIVPENQPQGSVLSQWEVPEVEKTIPLETVEFDQLKIEARGNPDRQLDRKISTKPEEVDFHNSDSEEEMAKAQIDILLEENNTKRAKEKEKKTDTNQNNGAMQVPEVQFGPSAEIRRRGRPRGSKDQVQRNRRTKRQMRTEKLNTAHAMLAEDDGTQDFYSHFASCEEDEEIVEAEVFLAKVGVESKPGDSVGASWAFSPNNPERPKWIEAKDKEQARLMAYETWRKLTPEEESDWKNRKIKAVPCALILNRKRCGRYKARLVVLGNRWEPTGDNCVYASVVSQVGNRATLVHAAKNGYHVIPFDIGNAFIRASMGSLKVAVTIPETFRDKDPKDNGRRMLLKALYGLPISPRLWAKCLGKDLLSKGWKECINEPGVWRKLDADNKPVGYLTVYVDDCVLACKDKETAEKELQIIHDLHPLSVIECKETPDGGIKFDLTGADIEYNSKLKTLKISMASYIRKMLTTYDMLKAKPRNTPSFEEKNLYDKSSKECNFPFRNAVGALQWATTCARPDLAHSVNMLARAGSQKCTVAMQKCARLVFRYLLGTIEWSLNYSPESEEKFNTEFDKIARDENENASMKDKLEQIKEPIHLFTDASFGVEYKAMKSITGIVLYLHGTPIAWRSKVQSIFTSCTTQSEFVALSDAIQFSNTIYGLQRFLIGKPETDENCGPIWSDNRGAVLIGRKGNKNRDEIPKRSRHVALKYSEVLNHSERLFWVPTENQRADGLTKSLNKEALRMIMNNPKTKDFAEADEEEEETFFSALSMCAKLEWLTCEKTR
ncbi:MAG: hypothetical protein CMH81_08185 [Nitrospiraceae bacterium]|nr:hypothetical protein [Nitrospiraceae bacterium]